VNTLAPYMLTALIDRPGSAHTSAADCITRAPDPSRTSTGPGGPGNAARAYSESKLHVTALALTPRRALGQKYSATPSIRAGTPTKMGGPYATDDLEKGYLTQT